MKKYSLLLLAAGLLLAGAGCVASAPGAPPAQPRASAAGQPDPADGKNVVTYTDSGFSPATITVKKGDTVTFRNDSTAPMWVAANPHPVHTGYPVGGGCIGSAFDECAGADPGSSWSFTFDQVGSWGYHNHRRASDQGTVVVTP